MLSTQTLPQITDAMVQQYVEDGFLVVENVFDDDDIAAMTAEAPKIARGSKGYPALLENADKKTDLELEQEILCIHFPHVGSDVIREYVCDQRVAHVLSKVTAAHLPASWWDGSVKCMQSMYFCKPPGMPGQAWHQDEIYIPTRDRSLVGAWYALDDANVENGCLWVIPGSHRNGMLYEQRAHHNPEFDGAQQSFGFDDSGEIPVVVKKGSVVFFNGHLLHRSAKNRSEADFRRVLVNHYMNSYSFLPWGAGENGVPVARSDKRAVMFVSGKDPYPERPLIEHDHISLRGTEEGEEWKSIKKG